MAVAAVVTVITVATVAIIVMDHWLLLFASKLDKAGVVLRALLKYVDDVNVVCSVIRRGTRWRGEQLVWNREWEVEDTGRGTSDGVRTLELIREAADTILPWLQFTLDHPDLHPSVKVPMLDVRVWIDHGAEMDPPRADILKWEFYEKPLASSKVLRASTAYAWRSKMVTLNMETFRRHRNTSCQVPRSRRVWILMQYVIKLRSSGYGPKTVSNILQEGSRHYYRKLRTDLEGGPELNRRVDSSQLESRRSKLGASEVWFRGGEGELRRDTPRTMAGEERVGLEPEVEEKGP